MPDTKTAIVTGAFGFAGANLVENLVSHGYRVIAVGRKGSSHNDRLKDLDITEVFLDMCDYDRLSEVVPDNAKGDVFFFHLAWGGGRNDAAAQEENVLGAQAALRAAAKTDKDLKINNSGKVRFIAAGSQAEINPVTEYGRCKEKAYELLKVEAEGCGLDFIWARIFSLIGKYEPYGRMLPDLVRSLSEGNPFSLSSCEQKWDYLDAADAAEALRFLAEKGKNGEVYDVARGDNKTLREYVEEAADILGADRSLISFGERAEPFISLEPSIERLKEDTGWYASVSFKDSVLKYNISLKKRDCYAGEAQ